MIRDKAIAIADGLATIHKLDAVQVKTSPFVDFLVQLLKTLLPMLIACLPVAATVADVAAATKNLNFWQKWYLRRTIRQQIGDSTMQDLLAGPLQTEIEKAGAALTADDAQAAMDEIA